MTRKEGHGNKHRGSSPEGCWKLAGDNIPGHRAIMTPRPGGAPDERKICQGMQAQSRLDLDFYISTLCPIGLRVLPANRVNRLKTG